MAGRWTPSEQALSARVELIDEARRNRQGNAGGSREGGHQFERPLDLGTYASAELLGTNDACHHPGDLVGLALMFGPDSGRRLDKCRRGIVGNEPLAQL